MRFCRQEFWSGLPFPPPGDLPDSGMKPTSSVNPHLPCLLNWQANSSPVRHLGSLWHIYIYIYISWSNHKKLVIIHHIIKLCFFFSDENFKDLSLSNFKTQDTILLAFGTVLWQTNYIPVAYLFYNQKCILLWLYLFILSGVISLLFSSSILSTYQPGEFIFQCHIFLPFHTVHGILKARILK